MDHFQSMAFHRWAAPEVPQQGRARLEVVVSIDRSPSWGPSFPTVEMVWEMLLENVEVFKWLLGIRLQRTFPSLDMEYVANPNPNFLESTGG